MLGFFGLMYVCLVHLGVSFMFDCLAWLLAVGLLGCVSLLSFCFVTMDSPNLPMTGSMVPKSSACEKGRAPCGAIPRGSVGVESICRGCFER